MIYLKLTLHHMFDKRGMIILIMVELIIAILSLSYFSTSIINQNTDNRFYKELELDKIMMVNGDQQAEDILKEFCEQKTNETIYLGQVLTGLERLDSVGNGTGQVIPISKDLFNCIKYSFYEGSKDILQQYWNENVMYVPYSMRAEYQVGNYYTLDVRGEDSEVYRIEVVVGGILSSDRMYCPGQGINIVENSPNKTMIYFGKNKEVIREGANNSSFYDEVGRNYYLYTNNTEQRLRVINQLEQNESINYVVLLEDNNSMGNQWKSSKLGIPWIMSFTLIFMCSASFASYTMLSVVQREKNYAIYYMCGATWDKCLTIKLFEDLIMIVVPGVISWVVMCCMNLSSSMVLFSGVGQLISIMLAVFIILGSSSVSFIIMKKKSPISLIRRCI